MLCVLIFIWNKKLALYVVKNVNACIRINKNTLLQFFFFFSGLYFQKILYIRVKLSYLSCEFKRLDKETHKSWRGKKLLLRRTLYRAAAGQLRRRLKEEQQQQILQKKNQLEKKICQSRWCWRCCSTLRGEQRARAMLLTTYTYIRIQEYMTVYIYYCLLKRISC